MWVIRILRRTFIRMNARAIPDEIRAGQVFDNFSLCTDWKKAFRQFGGGKNGR